MLATYARDQRHGVDPATLSALGKQITAAAKALGQHVTLPRAATNGGASTASSPTNGATDGKLHVTA